MATINLIKNQNNSYLYIIIFSLLCIMSSTSVMAFDINQNESAYSYTQYNSNSQNQDKSEQCLQEQSCKDVQDKSASQRTAWHIEIAYVVNYYESQQ